MDVQKAIDLIEKSGHIAILLPEEASFDALAASETLTRFLMERGKLAGTAAERGRTVSKPEIFKNLASLSPLPKEFVISLDTSQAPVAELRYEKLDDRIEVVFSPKSSSLNEKYVSFRQGKTLCDCAILTGVSDPDTLGSAAGIPPEFFTETPLINLDRTAENKRYGEANLVDPEKSSLSEICYNFLTAFRQSPLSKEDALLLLAGILQATQGFRKEGTSADTLLAASELMRLGAGIEEAFALIGNAGNPHTLSFLQLYSRAAVRSKTGEDGQTLWSFLTPEDFEKTGRDGRDSSKVLARLSRETAGAKIHTLLWQDTRENSVHALLAGDRNALETLGGREPGEFQSPYFAPDRTFPTFREAEEHLASIIQTVIL